MHSSVSVVVPTYRGAATLPELVQRLTAVLSARGCQYEILLIDDASPDEGATWSSISDLASADPQVRGFRLLRNRGQHNALLLGIREAKFETIVTIDDDLQNPPEEVPKLLDTLESENAHVVYGVPRDKAHGAMQNIGSRFVSFSLVALLGSAHARHASSFRAFRTVLRNSFVSHESPRVSVDALLGWGATRFSHVVVDHRHREHGHSGYSMRKLVGHALTMITSYSTIPLRVASLTGFLFVIFGMGVFIYVMIGRLTGIVTQPGFAFLVSLLSLLGGVQLVALGIIGEYIATVFMRSLGMPAYTLAERTDIQQ